MDTFKSIFNDARVEFFSVAHGEFASSKKKSGPYRKRKTC